MPKITITKAAGIWLIIILMENMGTSAASGEVDIIKCCNPQAEEVFDLYSKSCQTLDADYLEDLNTFHIEANLGYDAHVQVSEVDLPICNETIYEEKHLIVLADNDVGSSSGFFTDYEHSAGNNSGQLILYDLNSGQKTKEFCLDRAYDLGPYSTSVSFLLFCDEGNNPSKKKSHSLTFLQITFKGTVAVQCRTSTEAICSGAVGNQTCIHHCCPLFHFQNDQGFCEHYRGSGTDPEWIFENSQAEDHRHQDYYLLYDGLKCDKITYNLSLYQWEFYPNGDLKIESSLYGAADYCLNEVEVEVEAGGYVYSHDVQVCVHAEGDCKGEFKAWDCLVNRQLLPATFCLSMLFFGLLALHLWMTKKEKLFECMMISNIGMLCLVYLVLFVDKMAGSFLSPHPVLCEIRGLIIQFGFISSLFWLNSMSHLSKYEISKKCL